MKYVDTRIVFSEVPDEISLAISISGCTRKCKNCHSAYLQKDTGEELTPEKFEKMISKLDGVTCICLMGGDKKKNIPLINSLFSIAKRRGFKTCWYIGSAVIPYGLNIHNMDYIKLGEYNEELGPLTSKTTNQKFIKITFIEDEGYKEPVINIEDITYKFNGTNQSRK